MNTSTQQLSESLKLRERAEQKEERLRQDAECVKEQDGAHESANKDQAEYDKQLLTLSTGLLALSIGFINQVVKLDTAVWLWCLYLSFGLLTAAIISVLFSFQFSISGNLASYEYWQRKRQWLEKKQGDEPRFPELFADAVKWLNRGCGIVFGLGITFTVIFVIANLQHQRAEVEKGHDMDMKSGPYVKAPSSPQEEERGSLMKVPAAKPAAPAPDSKSGATK